MINLLPPDVKDNYRYARRNSQLLRWTIACTFALLGLVILTIGGAFYLDQTAKDYSAQADSLEASLKAQDEDAIRKQVTEISSNLKLAVTVLSNQVLYSQMLQHLATIIPANTSLTGITLSPTQTSLDIAADTADYNAATQLQINLADPKNGLFSKADIVSITCTPADASTQTTKKYPCSATIRALFVKDNPYTSTSKSGAAQ
jgi:Tfp pilus assembly protein PilN